MQLSSVVDYLDGFFRDFQCSDFSNNGLQVEASAEVSKVGFAVDGCFDTVKLAAEAGVQLLVVHHGISWGQGFKALVGRDARRVAAMFRNGVSLYGMHLPLDAHPLIGNNAVIATMLGVQERRSFLDVRGLKIGVSGALPAAVSVNELAELVQVKGVTDRVVVHENGIQPIKRVCIVSGSGGDCVEECVLEGAQCLITGEFGHAAYHYAKEAGLSVIACGHYNTEVWGVRSLMPSVAQLGLETVFLPAPTGL